MMFPKDPPHRDRRLLDLAHKLHECQVQVPDVCIGHSPHGCEPAHGDSAADGKGTSRKAHDALHAASCHPCHEAMGHGSRLSREDREYYWTRGHKRTIVEYFRRGWLEVVG